MKLKHNNRQYESTVTGKKVTMGFAKDAAAHLAELMSNSVYQDKYGSIVREVVSNAIDANKESGSTNKVIVNITEKPALSDQVGYLSVQDFGPGISPERIENIFTQYFASTKRDTNEQIGGFGIGAKSPFAYTPVFEVITTVDGVKRTYLMEKSSAERTCTMISEVECNDTQSGTIVRIPIASSQDEYRFIKAIKDQLVLLADRIVFNIPAKHDFVMPTVIDYGKVLCIQTEDGRYLEHDGTMISLGDVLYKIPSEDTYTYRNYVLKFNIGELSPTLSREGIELNEDAKVKIHNKHCQFREDVEQWCKDQAIPTKDLIIMTSMREKRRVVYPESSVEVQIGASSSQMDNYYSVPIEGDGWPKQFDAFRFNQVIQQHMTVSARYHRKSGKWRSPNTIALIRDVIRDNSYQNYDAIIKPSGQSLSGVWKEYYAEIDKGTSEGTVVITVSSNTESLIRDIFKRDLSFMSEEEANQVVEEAVQFTVESMNDWFKTKCTRYRDIQPPQDWLDRRKEAMKARKLPATKWTADMLKEIMPVKIVAPCGSNRRAEMKIEDLTKKGVVVVQNKVAKNYQFEQEYTQPVKIVIVSEGNFKRLQKIGAHVWTEDHMREIYKRRERQAIERRKNQMMSDMSNAIDRAIYRLMVGGGHHCMPPLVKKRTQKDVRFYDLNYKYLSEAEVIVVNGVSYSKKKVEAIARNIRKIMKRSICTEMVYQSLDHHGPSNKITTQFLSNLLNPK
jgi:hypothetical protein